MSGNFDVTAVTAYISMTAGSASAVGSGGYTIAVLCQPAAGNNNASFAGAYASGTVGRALFEDTNHLFGANDFSSGFGALTQGSWYVLAQTKAAGSNTYRHHIWTYDATGAGLFSHGVSTGSSAQGDGSATTELRIGAAVTKGNGLIAVVGLWTRPLSDAELDSMRSGNLTAWRDVTGGQPAELVSLENWNGATGSTAVIGTSTQSSITGTVATGANPPSFNFALTGTVSGTATLTGAGVVTASTPSTVSGTATLTGAGTLTSSAVQRATATLTGAGTLSASVNEQATATLTGAGTLTSAVVQQVTAALTGAGTLTSPVVQRVTATPTGAGVLTVSSTQQAAAALTAAGTLTSSAVQQATATLTGAGVLTAGSAGSVNGTANLTAAGTLAAPAVQSAAAALVGAGSVAVGTITQGFWGVHL